MQFPEILIEMCVCAIFCMFVHWLWDKWIRDWLSDWKATIKVVLDRELSRKLSEKGDPASYIKLKRKRK